MATFQDVAVEGTVYFHCSLNDTDGKAADGTSPAFDVRLCGGGAGDAPVYSGTPALLTHANYTNGLYEIAVPATTANGFVAGNTYAVFATATVDAETPAGFVGSFRCTAAGDTLHDAAARVMDQILATGVMVSDPSVAAILAGVASAVASIDPKDYEDDVTCGKGTFAWWLALISGVFAYVVTDNLDGTADGQLSKSTGADWGTPVKYDTVTPSSTTPPVVRGTQDSH